MNDLDHKSLSIAASAHLVVEIDAIAGNYSVRATLKDGRFFPGLRGPTEAEAWRLLWEQIEKASQ